MSVKKLIQQDTCPRCDGVGRVDRPITIAPSPPPTQASAGAIDEWHERMSSFQEKEAPIAVGDVVQISADHNGERLWNGAMMPELIGKPLVVEEVAPGGDVLCAPEIGQTWWCQRKWLLKSAPHQGKELTDAEIERMAAETFENCNLYMIPEERWRNASMGALWRVMRILRDNGYLRPSPRLSVDEVMEVVAEWVSENHLSVLYEDALDLHSRLMKKLKSKEK